MKRLIVSTQSSSIFSFVVNENSNGVLSLLVTTRGIGLLIEGGIISARRSRHKVELIFIGIIKPCACRSLYGYIVYSVVRSVSGNSRNRYAVDIKIYFMPSVFIEVAAHDYQPYKQSCNKDAEYGNGCLFFFVSIIYKTILIFV